MSPRDVIDLHHLAASIARHGKRHAARAYHDHALERNWQNTPAWTAGREEFTRAHRAMRAALGKSNTVQKSRARPVPACSASAMGD